MTAQRMLDKFREMFPNLYDNIRKYVIPSDNSSVKIILNDGTEMSFVYRKNCTWCLEGK